MSLINDALRQASQDQKQQEAPPVLDPFAEVRPPLIEPLTPQPVSPWASLLPVVLVAVVVVGLLGVGGWLAWKAWNGKRAHIVAQARALSTETPPLPTGASAPTNSVTENRIAPAPQAVRASAPPAVPVAARPASVREAALPSSAAVPASRQAPPVKWPTLKLQGIIFNPPDASVIINNKMLFLEDEILGVKVTEIGRSSVVLVMEGQTNTLRLR